MVIYKRHTCNKQFKQKSHYISHTENKSYPCDNTLCNTVNNNINNNKSNIDNVDNINKNIINNDLNNNELHIKNDVITNKKTVKNKIIIIDNINNMTNNKLHNN